MRDVSKSGNGINGYWQKGVSENLLLFLLTFSVILKSSFIFFLILNV